MNDDSKIVMPCTQGTLIAYTESDAVMARDSIIVYLVEPDGSVMNMVTVNSDADGISCTLPDEMPETKQANTARHDDEMEVLPGQMTIFDVLDGE